MLIMMNAIYSNGMNNRAPLRGLVITIAVSTNRTPLRGKDTVKNRIPLWGKRLDNYIFRLTKLRSLIMLNADTTNRTNYWNSSLKINNLISEY